MADGKCMSNISFHTVFTAWNTDFNLYAYAFLLRCIFFFKSRWSLLNNISLVRALI